MKTLILSLLLTFAMTISKADTANPSDPDTWQVTANNYQYSLTITTALVFDLEESRDVTDKIAAFVGDDCRGVAQPITYVPETDRYLAHLLVYSDNVSGDSITLYMYDQSSGEIIEIAEKLVFVSNAAFGNADDPYLSRTSYDITFVIEANENPINEAEVFLDGYGTKITGADGQVTYTDVFPSDSIYYNVIADGFENYDNSLSLIDTSITRTIDMAFEAYDVSFSLTDGVLPIKGAVIMLDGYGQKTSDVYGNVLFPDVIVQDDIEYEIYCDGFYNYSNSLSVTDTEVNSKVTLSATSYNLTFSITGSNDQSLEDAEITCVTNDEDEIEDFILNEFPVDYTSKGNGLWEIDSETVFQGEFNLTSGNIFDNQISQLSFEKYTREGNISFYTKVSSEEDNDYLTFLIDGIEMGRWSGDTGWELAKYTILEGLHTFEWIYKKDGSSTEGEDCAWIDYIVTPSAESVSIKSITDNNGQAEFYSLDPTKKIVYSIYSENHEESIDTLALLLSDTQISLALVPVFNVSFDIISDDESGNIDVQNAIVNIGSEGVTETTDIYGEAAFTRVSINNEIPYIIIAEGYDDISGVLSVTNADVTQNITLILKEELQAANFISPNGDGVNDYWEIYNAERYQEFSIDIYSSAGEKIYHTIDYENNKWDGKVNGNKIPDGIYYYFVTSPLNDMVFKGIINLIN